MRDVSIDERTANGERRTAHVCSRWPMRQDVCSFTRDWRANCSNDRIESPWQLAFRRTRRCCASMYTCTHGQLTRVNCPRGGPPALCRHHAPRYHAVHFKFVCPVYVRCTPKKIVWRNNCLKPSLIHCLAKFSTRRRTRSRVDPIRNKSIKTNVAGASQTFTPGKRKFAARTLYRNRMHLQLCNYSLSIYVVRKTHCQHTLTIVPRDILFLNELSSLSIRANRSTWRVWLKYSFVKRTKCAFMRSHIGNSAVSPDINKFWSWQNVLLVIPRSAGKFANFCMHRESVESWKPDRSSKFRVERCLRFTMQRINQF